MTSPNTIIADLVDDRNRMSAALHRIVFEAASYSDCVAIAVLIGVLYKRSKNDRGLMLKDFIGAGILPYPPQTVAVANGEECH
jgi:hypothetical protein